MENWTDEMLVGMIENLNKRKERELKAIKGIDEEPVSPEILSKTSRGNIKIVKKPRRA